MSNIVTRLRKLNIGVSLVDDKLKLRAPEGALTSELLEEIKKNKAFIIQYIKGANDAGHYSSIPSAERKEYYALSLSQRGLYFLYEMDRGSLAYNMPHVMEVEGVLEEGKLAEAFGGLVARHEGLRTCFRMVGEEPVQQVKEKMEVVVEYYEEGEGLQEVMRRFVRPFELETGPLLRVGLVRRGGDRYWLLLDMHHIITDGVSQGILVRDFLSLYKGEAVMGHPLQYRDYVEWQQSSVQQELLGRQRSFWLGEFGELPEQGELPLDHAREGVRSQRGKTMAVEIEGALLSGLKALAEGEGATLYMALLSVYTILLGRLTDREDVVVGTSTVGRPHAELEGTIGIFINTLCLRNYPKGEKGFREYLREVRDRTLACFDNQSYPYESLLKVLGIERRADRNVLFDAAITYSNFDQPELSIPGLRVREHMYDQELSKYDLLLWVSEEGGEMRLELSYSTELFEAGTIDRYMEYFRRIMSEVLKDGDVRLSAIRMLGEKEEERLCVEFNDTDREWENNGTVVELFREGVRLHPELVAVRCGEEEMSYGNDD